MGPSNNPVYIIILFVVLGLVACKENVSKPGERIYSCLTECTYGTSDGDGYLRIISLNFYHGYPDFINLRKRLDLLARHIVDINADIVFLQEVPWHKETGLAVEYLSKHTNLNYAYIRANGNFSMIRFEEGIAIMSRFPLKAPRYIELLPRPGGFEHRTALAATAVTPFSEINLVTTHLSRRRQSEINAAQTASLKEFVDSLDPVPAIVAGDFNAIENSPQIMQLTKNWIDAFRKANPGTAAPTCCLRRTALNQADAGKPFARVDYVFLAPYGSDWDVIHSQRIFNKPVNTGDHYQWVSNHMGVLVDTKLVN